MSQKETKTKAHRRKVVIIGAGFGGLSAAKTLCGAPVDVVVIDRTNHHLFQPLLYQVATAGLSPADIAAPVRALLGRERNVRVVLGEVERIEVANRQVCANGRVFDYDYLILAAGARHSYFGHHEWRRYAPGLKTLEDALDLRRRILLSFELAENAMHPIDRSRYLTFVVVGAGPTGVEMAGAISELARHTLRQQFKNINPLEARIVLVEGGPRVLPGFDTKLSQKALVHLGELGIEVRLNTAVSDVDETGVVAGGERIASATVVWAAGNEASPLTRLIGTETDRVGRLKVDSFLHPPQHPEIFVIGDNAHCLGADGKPLPGVSPVAIQQGKWAAKAIMNHLRGKQPKPFSYFDKGSMATIGRHAAVAQIGPLKFGGFLAWLGWLFVHLIFLVGFRNRLFVLLQWAYAYITFRRGARLITGEVPGFFRHQKAPPELSGQEGATVQ